MLRYLKENVNVREVIWKELKRSQVEILKMRKAISEMTDPFKGISNN